MLIGVMNNQRSALTVLKIRVRVDLSLDLPILSPMNRGYREHFHSSPFDAECRKPK
jgi:hypothetical protein